MQLFEVQVKTYSPSADQLTFGPFSKREMAEQLVVELARRPDVISAEIVETEQPVQD